MRLRGELSANHKRPVAVNEYHWDNPREAIRNALRPALPPRLRIAYRGLRRIEELSEVLTRDRVLEDFGVLLSIRYVRKDLEAALRRASDIPVSLLYADMDNFKRVNTNFGHDAGDVVMRKYLEVVRDRLGIFGTAYRGLGDEVVALIVGQDHQRAVELAESIRQGVEGMVCDYKGERLPAVTSSIGVATTPPEPRSIDLQNIADGRQQIAKNGSKNCVIAQG
jgi:diguanylate cyclase (GGDEF)-like protein